MKVLITGSEGFVGKNLSAALERLDGVTVLRFGSNNNTDILDMHTKACDFVFHLAGVNRPKDESEFMTVNTGFTSTLLSSLASHNNDCPIVFTSSTQALQNNFYGKSKKTAEELIFTHAAQTGAKVCVYRLANVFGKWCRPNYNSVIATFCHNIAYNLSIHINDPNTVMNLIYIDDLLEEFIRSLKGMENKVGNYCEVPILYSSTLGEIAELIYSFKRSREERSIPDMSDGFAKKLYSTYLSYLPTDQLNYPLKMNIDNRGSFTEFIKTPDRGQVSINISKPGIVKGNHWHHTKNEKFLVVSGKGVIRFRKLGSEDIIEYRVSGEYLEVVDIPVGYTHNIENIGDTDMVTIMWANESFDPEKPDTYYLEV